MQASGRPSVRKTRPYMKNRFFVAALCGLALSACSRSSDEVRFIERPVLDAQSVNYTGNRAPLAPAAFIKLPLGAIEPQGWIRELLVRQKQGLAGNLSQISAWLDKRDNAWLSEGGKAGWEEVPYWLRGYSDMAFMLGDGEMQREAMVWIEGILASRQSDGWFGPIVRTNRGTRDFWSNMLVLFTLSNYYEATGDERVIDLMRGYFRYQLTVPDEEFLATYWEHSRGGDNLLSVYWLYNLTGEEWLLELAEKIDRCTADWRQPSNLPNWHNVNVAQGFRQPATFFMQSRDSADLRASYNDYHLIRRIFGQVPGGMFGSDENCRMGYVDPRQGTETCGFAEQMTSDGIMTRITGDVVWADNCEDILFNSFPAAFMPDMRALRYITAPNMVRSDAENHAPGIDNGGPFLMMNPFSSRCCQHNHGHALPYYVGNMFMATNDNGLLANLYGSADVRARAGEGVGVTITERSDYPFEEQVRFTVTPDQSVVFPLYLRIPSWCKGAAVTINGRRAEASVTGAGYLRIERTWQPGDRVELSLPMALSLRRWCLNRNSVSVDYGPLTFSLKIDEEYRRRNSAETAIGDSRWQADADPARWPSYEIHSASAWNYALVLDAEDPTRSMRVERRPFPADNYPFTPDAAPITIRARGKRVPGWEIDRHGLCGILPDSPVRTDAPEEELTLIPMGCARLRISAFPTAE